jgi:hypothetical protein
MVYLFLKSIFNGRERNLIREVLLNILYKLFFRFDISQDLNLFFHFILTFFLFCFI